MTEESGREWNEMLRDRSRVLVRPIRPEDVSCVADFVDALSPQSRYALFLAGIARLSDRELRRLCDPDCARDVAYVAVDSADPGMRLIGIGRYAESERGEEAELSVAVADAWQHRGLGTLLLRHLIAAAREHGVRRLSSVDSAANYRMHELARRLGFRVRTDPDDPRQVIFSLELRAAAGPDERPE